ncbi:MAG: DUF4386 domain-containing protein [Rhodobacteraceae bacterium]|nr:DUF4386 domain-containing protein [Paracoccaceae bacterium]
MLFIIATAFLFVGEAFYKPGLTPPDVLAKAAGAKSQITIGLLIEFTCVLAIPLIAIVLYPILRQVSAVLAIGYVAFRLFEGALFASMEIDKMLVLSLSENLSAHPSADMATLEVLAQSLTGGGPLVGTTGSFYNLVFVIGMLMLNWMLWQSRLVPRWISAWGLISAVVLGSVAILVLFAPIPDTLAIVLIAPLAVQEMVFALWLIIKGFDPDALIKIEGT